MQIIANQKEEIAELRKHVAAMENRQQEYINTKLEERGQNLLKALRETQESENKLQPLNRKNGGDFGNKK